MTVNGSRLSSLLALGVIVASASRLTADCVIQAKSGDPGIPPGTNYVNVSIYGISDATPVLDAMATWNGGCSSHRNGGNLPFPHFTMGSYAATYEITVTLVTGHASGGAPYPIATTDDAGDITVYTLAGPAGATPTYASDPDTLKGILRHELGHSLHIDDATNPQCDGDLMYAYYSPALTLSADDCDVADEQNETYEEDTGCQDISCEYSPIVIALRGSAYRFSSLRDGVWFDINGDGSLDHIGWTSARSDIAFLWLDRNGDGVPSTGPELFGNATPYSNGRRAANGFAALRQYDLNADDVIDYRDPVWPLLGLWVDGNHDGVAQSEELFSLSDEGIIAIELPYRAMERCDEYGNTLRWQGRIWRVGRGGRVYTETIYDVVFVHH